ncbi:unnamed protein product [Cuscuta campestris]|uniref:Uncharacterized protein n=1 Tax=Cuscuta campestris TaxID=132261 RepID=A0A484KDD0_9ASTE|nr:unnamed protein product [Cuscuta campestris]
MQGSRNLAMEMKVETVMLLRDDVTQDSLLGFGLSQDCLHVIIEHWGNERALRVWRLEEKEDAPRWLLVHKVIVSMDLPDIGRKGLKFAAFHPHDNNIIFFEMPALVIRIDFRTRKVKCCFATSSKIHPSPFLTSSCASLEFHRSSSLSSLPAPRANQDISASDARASEESLSSSSSTGSSSSTPQPRSNPNPSIPEPQPLNQMPGHLFAEREEPVNDEPAPYDPEKETRDQWVERLDAAGYSPLPTSFVIDIHPHVSKIALNKARRNLPVGYVLEFDENSPNIIEPHWEDRIDMNFRAYNTPKTTAGSSSAAATNKPVRPETVVINDEEEDPQTGGMDQTRNAPVNPSPNKGKGKMRTKKTATTHPAAKRKRGESSPVGESMEELWVKMTLKLKEMGEVGPEILEQLAGDPSSRLSQLEEQLKRSEAHNRELQDLTGRQLDEVANLARMAGEAEAEVIRLKEENLKLMEDLELKEREFPGRARQWVGENLDEVARVITSDQEKTVEAFKLIYREEQGKEMITQIGSYGFMSGQKRDREATHAVLVERFPDFDAESYGLAPIPDDEPAPPFPLE